MYKVSFCYMYCQIFKLMSDDIEDTYSNLSFKQVFNNICHTLVRMSM